MTKNRSAGSISVKMVNDEMCTKSIMTDLKKLGTESPTSDFPLFTEWACGIRMRSTHVRVFEAKLWRCLSVTKAELKSSILKPYWILYAEPISKGDSTAQRIFNSECRKFSDHSISRQGTQPCLITRQLPQNSGCGGSAGGTSKIRNGSQCISESVVKQSDSKKEISVTNLTTISTLVEEDPKHTRKETQTMVAQCLLNSKAKKEPISEATKVPFELAVDKI